MPRAGIVAAAALTALAGCAQTQRSAAMNAASPAEIEPAGSATEAPVAENLPPFDFPALRGWLGFATVTREKGNAYWSPKRPGAEVVHFSDAWAGVLPGTRFGACASDGEVVLTYLGTEEVQYGCEQNTQTVAVFDAERPVAEGPVWITAGQRCQGTVLPIEPAPVSRGAEQRSWRAGELELAAVKTAARAGELKVTRDGALLETRAFGKPDMAGADDTPLELSDEDEVGLLKPLAAWRMGADERVVLGRRSYEGHTFELLAVRDGQPLKVEGGVALYFCAF